MSNRPSPADAPTQVSVVLPPLVFASAMCVGMLALRWGWCGHRRFSGFTVNLGLAWIPLLLTLAIQWLHARDRPHREIWPCAAMWLLFFPNAPYIVTDLVHFGRYASDAIPPWFDAVLIMAFACTGLFLGCTSLVAMERLVRLEVGRLGGSVFTVAMLGLASFGIYLGRFLRLNSWDVLVRPARFIERIEPLAHPAQWVEVLAFALTFFAFAFAVQWFIASASRLRPAPTTGAV